MAAKNNAHLLSGNKLYQVRARVTFPFLVALAKAGKTITYSELATLVDMPNPRNLNYVLGAISEAISELNKQLEQPIPPIQCLVVTKGDGLPGDGVEGILGDYTKLSKPRRKKLIDRLLVEVYTYPHWDWVLEQFKLSPVVIVSAEELAGAGKTGFGGGESEQHRLFKEYIAANPRVLGLETTTEGIMEVVLASGDRLDIEFEGGSTRIAVEVKSTLSSDLDVLRGIYQCVKYKSVIEAEQAVSNKYPDSRVILALQGRLPKNHELTKTLLGVEVIDNIQF